MVLSPDGSRAYVQNSLLNIEGMNDGSISVIDLATGKKIDRCCQTNANPSPFALTARE